MSIGVLMLDTAFQRLAGDIGHPSSWPFDLIYEVISGATPKEVVMPDHASASGEERLTPFLRGTDALLKQGVTGITTTCGFLGLYQKQLADYSPVPVATSALLQYPMIKQQLGAHRSIGILTYSQPALTVELLTQTGCDVDAPRVGFDEASAFHRWIMTGDSTIPVARLDQDVRLAARALKASDQAMGAILCECTNLSPFIETIRAETQLPVYDMTTLLHWFHAGLMTSLPHTPPSTAHTDA